MQCACLMRTSRWGQDDKNKIAANEREGVLSVKRHRLQRHRAKMCKDAPAAVRGQLQQLLHDYEDLFPAQLPKGTSTEKGSRIRDKYGGGLNPHQTGLHIISALRSMKNYKPRSTICWHRGISGPAPALTVHQFYSSLKKDGALADVRRLSGSQSADGEGQIPSPHVLDDLLDQIGQGKALHHAGSCN